MKIEKGIVKYKDRSDIVCTYGTTDDGTKYYFLDENDEKKFTNGNRIVSSLLVEAIDPMVKASNIGVIDGEGVVVIPCVNRSIRPIDDNTILVEASVPISQSVIDAVELRNDPLAATKLVSTPATIKDKINKQMGTEGKYVFNDQFSEATICDINGNNLVDNEYYSFIAQANGKLYMSKNVAETDVKELSLTMAPLDVANVNVPETVVENALSADNSVVTAVDESIPADAVAPVDAMASSEDEIIPYNDELSTVVDESLVAPEGVTTTVEEKLPEVPALDSGSLESTNGDELLHDNAPDFLTAEDMLSATSDIPPMVEGNENELDVPAVNPGAEAGFDVMPTDMSIVAPPDELVADENGADVQPEIPAVVPNAMASVNNSTDEVVDEIKDVDNGLVAKNDVVSDAPVEGVTDTMDEVAKVAEESIESNPIPDVPNAADAVAKAAEESTEGVSIPEVPSAVEEVAKVAEESVSIPEVPNAVEEVAKASEESVPAVGVVDVPPVVEEESADVKQDADSIADETAIDIPAVPEVGTDVVESADAANNDSIVVEDKAADTNNVLDVISSFSNPVSQPDKLCDEVTDEVKAEKLGSDEAISSAPLTIDPHTVASTVDKDGNGINDSIDNGNLNNSNQIIDIFKDVKQPAIDDSVSKLSSSLDNSLDFLTKDYPNPADGFNNRPVESFGSQEYSIPNNSQYGSLFTDTKTDKLPYGDDNIMSDVVKSMSDLMRQNKEQRNTIVQYQERLDALEAQRRMAIEQYKQTAIRVEALSSKLRVLEENSTRLEARNQMYETRLHDQEKIIASQDRELKTLRPQLEGKQDLVKLLADAKALLGNDNEYSSYNDGSNYYRRVA